MASHWCILRCSNVNTLPLLRTLGREGVEVWSPLEMVTKRVPRANIKRTLEQALLPSYIFANVEQLAVLLAICEAPVSGHREFRIMHTHGRMPLIDDTDLAGLRLLERKSRAAVRKEPSVNTGDAVRLTDGGFAGLTGKVEKAGAQFSTITLDGFTMPMKVANYFLLQSSADCDTRQVA